MAPLTCYALSHTLPMPVMPRTRFIPELDGMDFGGPLPAPEPQSAALYPAAADEAVSGMENTFGNLVHALFLKDRLQADRPRLEALLIDMNSAAALLALDFFFKRVRPPSRPVAPFGPDAQPAEPSAPGRRWSACLQDRLQQYLRREFAQNLLWYGVGRYIPEEWVSRERLAARISKTIESWAHEQVAVAVDLKLPAPGGRDWLAQQSAHQWRTLKSALEKNRPSAANLIWELADGSWQVETAIVFAFAADSAGAVTVETWRPGLPPRSVRLDCLRPNGNPPAGDAVLAGLRSVAYQPSLPPMSAWQKFLYLIQVERLLWHLRRFRRPSMQKYAAGPEITSR
jgi:hypothetical protein